MKIKHNIQIAIIFAIIQLNCCIVSAHESYKPDTLSVDNPKQLKKQAEYAYRLGDYYSAIGNYEHYCKIKDNDYNAIFKLAELYRITRNYENAKNEYQKLISLNNNKFKDAHFHLAEIQMVYGNYKEALELFNKVRKNPRGLSDRNFSKQIRNYIKGCEENLKTKKTDNNILITIQPLGSKINQHHMDFSPFPINDSLLMFASLRESEQDKKRLLERKEIPVRKLYVAKKSANQWILDEPLDNAVNLKNTDTGNGVMDTEGKVFYFTRSKLNWKKQLISEIYKSELIDGLWSSPVKLPYPINDENYTSTQPAIGNDIRSGNEILYFVSNRPKGIGGLDIWFVSKSPRTGEFSSPRNVGRRINTSGDDGTPFYDNAMHVLYFSSNGWPGKGGKDIYKVTGSGASWKKNTALPVPINTGYDDSYLAIEQGKNSGFFASNRPGSQELNPGSCCEDLYSFSIDRLTASVTKGNVFNITNTNFYDILKRKFNFDSDVIKQGTPLPNVNVYLYQKDEGEKDFLVATEKTDENGNFIFNTDPNKDYIIRVENFGYFDKKVPFSTKKIIDADTVQLRPIGINFIQPNLSFRFNIYFEYGKTKLNEDCINTIDTTIFDIMRMLPNAVFEIASHTDNLGSEAYNQKLSEKRAENIAKYLISKGIDENRLVTKGYGESIPIAPNQNADETDNPEGRKQNRRSEIKIIDSLNTLYKEES